MKRFFSEHGILVLTAGALIAIVLCVISAISSGTGLLHNALGILSSPFRAATGAVTSWVESVGDHFDSLSQLREENEELKLQIADLEQQIRQAQKDSEENARLRNLLSLSEQRNDLTFVSVKITENPASNWTSTYTLSKGTSSDIAIGDCVVDQYGFLVGVITESGYNWSTLTTIIDPSSQIGSKVFRTDESAIAIGDLTLMKDDTLKLGYISDVSNLINGDLIVTSGLGGYYPSGLVIGTMNGLFTDSSGLSQYALIKPKTDFSDLSEIFVITEFDVVD